jgi:hypothetical protein
VFREVDSNSFKDLASIADAWLGWSWAEDDTIDSETENEPPPEETQSRKRISLVGSDDESLASSPRKRKKEASSTRTRSESPTAPHKLGQSTDEEETETTEDDTEESSLPRENITSVSRASSMKSETESPKKTKADKIKTLPRSRGSDPSLRRSKKARSSERNRDREAPKDLREARLKKSRPSDSPEQIIEESEEPMFRDTKWVRESKWAKEAMETKEEGEDHNMSLRRTSLSFLPVG